MIKAIYKETGKSCWVNMDYIVDVFPYDVGRVIAYTFDNDRGGYVIKMEKFMKHIDCVTNMRGEEV